MAGPEFRIELDAHELPAMIKALEKLGEKKLPRAMRWALGKAGDRGYTASKRSIAKELGLKQSVVAADMRKRMPGFFEFVVDSEGARLPLRYYSPRQTKKGVTARIYGKRILHPHAFIIRRYENNVYRRLTKQRFPIKGVTGPAIPIEMVREHSVEAFVNALQQVFPAELRRITERWW